MIDGVEVEFILDSKASRPAGKVYVYPALGFTRPRWHSF